MPSSDSQSLRSGSAGTHEPICTRATRPCWIEFSASLASIVLGLVCILAGAANDNSALSNNVDAVGAKVATYIGVALLIAGGLLMVCFGVHFRLVKRRLDSDRLMRCARLGVRPSSRYSAVPQLPAEPAVGIVATPSTMASSGATGSGFYSNPGFVNCGDELADSRPPAGSGASFSSTSGTSGIGSGSSRCSSSPVAADRSLAELSAQQLQQQPPQHRSMFAPYDYRSSQI